MYLEGQILNPWGILALLVCSIILILLVIHIDETILNEGE